MLSGGCGLAFDADRVLWLQVHMVSAKGMAMAGTEYGRESATCNVLRCHNPGAEPISGRHKVGRAHEAVVCVKHKREIDEGAAWDMHDFNQVIMARDMPPTLEKWSMRECMGSEGFTLVLETSDADVRPCEIFITAATAELLRRDFAARREQ